MITRRSFLSLIPASARSSFQPPQTIGLGMGDYGLRSLARHEAISLISSVGYDSIELALMPGYPADPASAGPEIRRMYRDRIRDAGLALPSLLEQVYITGDAGAHRASLERLKRDMQFAHDVKPGSTPPCVQTHLGGRTADWDRSKSQIVDRLGDWAETARSSGAVICIKGHHLNLMDTSERTVWVMRQLAGNPWLRFLFDYSHYHAAGESLASCLDRLLPYTALIAIKDGRPAAKGPAFDRLLPGEGNIDYVDYYRRLHRAGWNGHTIVEISGQIHSRPGYDPVATVQRCYANIAPKMKEAGVVRPGKVRH